jgi:hypothetical protein
MRVCRVANSRSWLFIGITACRAFDGTSVNRTRNSFGGTSVKGRKNGYWEKPVITRRDTASRQPTPGNFLSNAKIIGGNKIARRRSAPAGGRWPGSARPDYCA